LAVVFPALDSNILDIDTLLILVVTLVAFFTVADIPPLPLSNILVIGWLLISVVTFVAVYALPLRLPVTSAVIFSGKSKVKPSVPPSVVVSVSVLFGSADPLLILIFFDAPHFLVVMSLVPSNDSPFIVRPGFSLDALPTFIVSRLKTF